MEKRPYRPGAAALIGVLCAVAFLILYLLNKDLASRLFFWTAEILHVLGD